MRMTKVFEIHFYQIHRGIQINLNYISCYNFRSMIRSLIRNHDNPGEQ